MTYVLGERIARFLKEQSEIGFVSLEFCRDEFRGR